MKMNYPHKLSVFKHILLSIALLGLIASCAKDARSSDVAESSEAVEALPVAESKTTDFSQCRRLTDFETSEANDEWTVVNDNIMGGQSLGGPAFESSVMTFSGYINTNGGGFSSVRKVLEPNILEPYSRAVLRLKPDGRAYRLIMEDDLETRSAPTVHRENIEFGPVGEWQTVSVAFDQLQPSVFGDPVEAPPFRKDLASRLGLMLNDVGDGPFQLEVDWIDLCP
ncbi:MAG: CIA30 family protein [Elainellaceae cyanobacterium]